MKKFYSYMLTAGGIMVLIGAALQITQLAFAPYLYLIGALMFAFVQISSRYEGDSIVIRRLRRQQILGALLLVVAGFLMIFMHHNEWVACLTIAAFIELYTVFRISSEEK